MDWCELNHLQLNISKTKELVVDFRRSRTPAIPFSMVEMIQEHKYLGVDLESKLDWTRNSAAFYRKG